MSKTTGPKSSKAKAGETKESRGGTGPLPSGKPRSPRAVVHSFTLHGCCSWSTVVWEGDSAAAVLLCSWAAPVVILCKAECWPYIVDKLLARTWRAKIRVSADVQLGPALELGNLNSASGQLQVCAVPEVLLCVEPVTCQMLLTLLSDLTSFPIPSFIPVTLLNVYWGEVWCRILFTEIQINWWCEVIVRHVSELTPR